MRLFRQERRKFVTHHYVFDYINFVQKVVAICGRSNNNLSSCDFCLNIHFGESFNGFFCRKVRTHKLVDCIDSCRNRFLKIERSYDRLSESGIIRMIYLYWQNRVSRIRKIACNDVYGKQKRRHISTGHLNHKVFVAYLNSTESSTVDNRSHGHYFVFGVYKKRELFCILKNPAIFFSFRMIGKNLTAGHFFLASKRNKRSLVWIYSFVIYRPGNIGGTINTHRN